MASIEANQRRGRLSTWIVLSVGFGALLTLMTAAALEAVRVVEQIETASTQIRRDFFARERTLDQISFSLYQAATVTRDYLLLDPGQSDAETLRDELKQLRAEMDLALKAYSRSLRPGEQELFRHLEREANAYWALLDPVFAWNARERRQRAYQFARRELFPRRAAVLTIARDIAALNERALREGEERTANAFAGFRRRQFIVSTTALVLGLVVATISAIYILRLERKTEKRYRETLQAQDELKKLSARLLEVQEQERRAISRELHDEVSQSLSSLLLDAGQALTAVPSDNSLVRRHLESIKKLAENSLSAVRNIALLLRPSMIDDLGLVPALQWQVREVSSRTDLRVDLVDENVSDSLPDEYRTCVYRVIQEALHNCTRHAQAQNVRIVVRQEPERMLVTIQDDGKGFDARRVRGLGLTGIAERVSHLQGTFQVASEPGRGTLLKIELPFKLEKATFPGKD